MRNGRPPPVVARPVESHRRTWGNILAALKHFQGAPLGRKFLEFFFPKWYILAYCIFLADGGAPKCRGVWGS